MWVRADGRLPDDPVIHACVSTYLSDMTLLDTVGLDIALAAAESLYAEFAEPHYAPPALLRRMVDAGRLGKKTGRGFYEYA